LPVLPPVVLVLGAALELVVVPDPLDAAALGLDPLELDELQAARTRPAPSTPADSAAVLRSVLDRTRAVGKTALI